MIVKKSWWDYKDDLSPFSTEKYYYTGWFLFGIIPLYIVRT